MSVLGIIMLALSAPLVAISSQQARHAEFRTPAQDSSMRLMFSSSAASTAIATTIIQAEVGTWLTSVVGIALMACLMWLVHRFHRDLEEHDRRLRGVR